MTRFLSSLSLGLVTAFAAVLALGIALPHKAAAVDFFGGLCSGAGRGTAACSGNGEDTISGTNGVILKVSGLLAIVAGVTAVIVLMIAKVLRSDVSIGEFLS